MSNPATESHLIIDDKQYDAGLTRPLQRDFVPRTEQLLITMPSTAISLPVIDEVAIPPSSCPLSHQQPAVMWGDKTTLRIFSQTRDHHCKPDRLSPTSPRPLADFSTHTLTQSSPSQPSSIDKKGKTVLRQDESALVLVCTAIKVRRKKFWHLVCCACEIRASH